MSNADEYVRYCPECGSIGPVPATAETCCPDSCGMQVRRWQAEKLERMLNQLRGAIAAERERCAKLVEPSEDHVANPNDYIAGEEGIELLRGIAETIRKG